VRQEPRPAGGPARRRASPAGADAGGWPRWLPRRGLPWPAGVRGYRRSWLRGDLLAGVTVAAYLVPQVMAYGRVAGLRPAAGLWAAVPALVIYAAIGSSRSLSFGPEATTALMTATAIGPLAGGQADRPVSASAAVQVPPWRADYRRIGLPRRARAGHPRWCAGRYWRIRRRVAPSGCPAARCDPRAGARAGRDA